MRWALQYVCSRCPVGGQELGVFPGDRGWHCSEFNTHTSLSVTRASLWEETDWLRCQGRPVSRGVTMARVCLLLFFGSFRQARCICGGWLHPARHPDKADILQMVDCKSPVSKSPGCLLKPWPINSEPGGGVMMPGSQQVWHLQVGQEPPPAAEPRACGSVTAIG